MVLLLTRARTVLFAAGFSASFAAVWDIDIASVVAGLAEAPEVSSAPPRRQLVIPQASSFVSPTATLLRKGRFGGDVGKKVSTNLNSQLRGFDAQTQDVQIFAAERQRRSFIGKTQHVQPITVGLTLFNQGSNTYGLAMGWTMGFCLVLLSMGLALMVRSLIVTKRWYAWDSSNLCQGGNEQTSFLSITGGDIENSDDDEVGRAPYRPGCDSRARDSITEESVAVIDRGDRTRADLDAELLREPGRNRATAFFWIGDDDGEQNETDAAAESAAAVAALPPPTPEVQSGARNCSTATSNVPLSPGTSESEPEAEPSSAAKITKLSLPLRTVSLEAPTSTLIPVQLQNMSHAPGRSRPRESGRERDASAASKVVMLYSSPLCYLDASGDATPLPQIAFEREWDVIERAKDAVARVTRDGRPTCRARPLTAANLQGALAPGVAETAATVLHLSAHGVRRGVQDCLVLDNGKGTAHFLNFDMLHEMLSLRKGLNENQGDNAEGEARRTAASPLRLVTLNACNSQSLGACLAGNGGIPHVLCTVTDVRDSWSQIFFSAFYGCLFQGRTVKAAFETARVALRNDPDAPSSAANAFCLLPEGHTHAVVLFPADDVSSFDRGGCAGSGSKRSGSSGGEEIQELPKVVVPSCPRPRYRTIGRRGGVSQANVQTVSSRPSPFKQPLPVLPEDFLGRSKDVWIILQHLSHRRLVVVCASSGAERGIGKSVVLDAVHRVLALQVASPPCIISASFAGTPGDASAIVWVEQLREAIRRVLRRFQPPRAQIPRRATGVVPLGISRMANQSSLVASRSLSDSATMESMLQALISDLTVLVDLRRSSRPSAVTPSEEILLVLHGCDQLVSSRFFQEMLTAVLRNIATCRILLSTQQRLEGSVCGQVKVVHHALAGLSMQDSARLFLRRLQRPIKWGELETCPGCGTDGAQTPQPRPPDALVTLPAREAEAVEVLKAVASHPAVAIQKGNPRGIIETASSVDPSLKCLNDAGKDILHKAAVGRGKLTRGEEHKKTILIDV